jgi:hypothetical protein
MGTIQSRSTSILVVRPRTSCLCADQVFDPNLPPELLVTTVAAIATLRQLASSSCSDLPR